MIRVGRRTGTTDPHMEGFENILVLMRSHSKWSKLGPYYLRNEKGEIFENIWQFSKIYRTVPQSTQRYSQWNPDIIWQWPAETHINENDEVTDAYWKWRKAGFTAEYAIRYPVGFYARHTCICTIHEGEQLDYVEARKAIYLKLYAELAKKQEIFYELKEKLAKGQNLLIVEIDGPHQESLEYYKKKYGVRDDFIENNTMLCTPKNLDIMLNDPKHPFGHGYCLAMALLDLA